MPLCWRLYIQAKNLIIDDHMKCYEIQKEKVLCATPNCCWKYLLHHMINLSFAVACALRVQDPHKTVSDCMALNTFIENLVDEWFYDGELPLLDWFIVHFVKKWFKYPHSVFLRKRLTAATGPNWGPWIWPHLMLANTSPSNASKSILMRLEMALAIHALQCMWWKAT